VVLYCLVSGRLPFASRNPQVTVRKNAKCQLFFPEARFAHVDPQIVRFLEQVMAYSPNIRLTATEALNHPWIAKHLDLTPKRSTKELLTMSFGQLSQISTGSGVEEPKLEEIEQPQLVTAKSVPANALREALLENDEETR
jgi:serine/threonine protein kinase